MRIREALPVDAAGIARVIVDTWRTTYRGIVPEKTLANLSYESVQARWESRLLQAAEGRFAFVLEDEAGQVAGYATGGPSRSDEPDYAGELYGLYILDVHHGKGLGRRLVQAVAARLAQEGRPSMLLWTFRDNPARAFYERLGGQYVRERPIDIDGVPVPEVAYGWPDTAALRESGPTGQGT
jgi:GNAT superfamily N-acetyltransferase